MNSPDAFCNLLYFKKVPLDIILKANGGGKQNRTAAFRMQTGCAPTRLYPQENSRQYRIRTYDPPTINRMLYH